jgi:general secretion pathway protein D
MRAVVDDSVDQKAVRFDIDNVNYAQATYALTQMTHTFLVPLDETTLIVAKEDATKLRDLQRQMQETIEVPGSTPEQLNELANVVRTIFSVSQATAQPAGGTIVVRAPQDVLDPLNRTLQGLLESSGEVMLEVKIYEIDTSNSRNIGATIPTQFTAFNVNQEATSIVESNQTLVQEAIAQGYISATASDLEIALALIGSGLVQNTLASNLIGTIGGGLIRTGISGSTNSNFNLSLNTTDNRSLDDVQLRTEDHQEALFREGTRYPVTSSTYSTGLSTAASALSNATINGVSVANLLSQYAGGTSATIPQVTYEDLGVTLKVTPVVQRSDRVNLKLDLKIEALAGGSANGIPVLANRQFASDITLKDGESALLASNVTKNETAAMTGLPGISELPGFQLPTDDNVARDTEQLVVVVTPHIVRERNERFAGPRIPVPNDARK